jgi:hypothetical protein
MIFNLGKLFNDLIEGFVFYIYEYARTIYILVRFPRLGPILLFFRNLKDPAHTIGPHAFVLINVFVAFLFMEFALPLIFAFWNRGIFTTQLTTTIDEYRNSEKEFTPLIIRSLIVLITIDVVLRLALSLLVHEARIFKRIQSSLLYSVGLQPLAIIVAFAYWTSFDLFNTHYEKAISLSAVALFFLLGGLFFMFLLDMFRIYVFRSARLIYLGTGLAGFSLLFFVAIYAEAVVLYRWSFLDGPQGALIQEMQCNVGENDNVELLAIVGNPTKQRIVISDINVFACGDKISGTVETSLGKDPAYFILKAGDTMWIRFRGNKPSIRDGGQKVCQLDLLHGGRSVVSEPKIKRYW